MPDISAMGDREIMARTLWGEARGEGSIGMAAVACVIMNRVHMDLNADGKSDWWGEGVKAVCLKPWQFSCWNEKDPNRAKILAANPGDVSYEIALAITDLTLDSAIKDISHGATHYFDWRMPVEKWPSWSMDKSPVAKIGNHAFYNLYSIAQAHGT